MFLNARLNPGEYCSCKILNSFKSFVDLCGMSSWEGLRREGGVFEQEGTPALPQNSLTLAGERGPANFDARHRGMLTGKLRPAQALQAAQVSLLRDERYSAPFYWAAFTLQGEWR
jgi:hypothetical protein